MEFLIILIISIIFCGLDSHFNRDHSMDRKEQSIFRPKGGSNHEESKRS